MSSSQSTKTTFASTVGTSARLSLCFVHLESDRLCSNMLLHGVLPPITTPFYLDDNVYYKKLEHNVERYSRTPVAGLVVLGSTGVGIMLSDKERQDVLKSSLDTASTNQ